MRFITLTLSVALLSACVSEPSLRPDTEQVIALSGDLTRADHQTYRELPFAVPRGVTSITVELVYNKDNRTVVDLGLRDPVGQRGWSGGNKSKFTVGEFEATPSYLPGRIQPGEWKLVLGIPNIREGQTSHYDAKVTLSSAPSAPHKQAALATDPVLSKQAGWRRGDFHAHTAHSDGSCDDGAGARGPCPLVHTAEAARDAKLDFIAITDHNTLSQRDPMRELQPSFPNVLLIPGTEITTFYGHSNAIGIRKPLEFQLGSARLPTVDKLLDEVAAQGAFLSINHPRQPSGEVCMGCGWTAKDTDWSRVAAIEVVNGSGAPGRNPEGPMSGIPLWDGLLKQGFHITAIGGSDNHDATDRTGQRQSPIGMPATVVYASDLSTKGIVDGVKSGRVFIDLSNTPGAVLDAEGRSRAGLARMGGTLELGAGELGNVVVTFQGVSGVIKLVSDGLVVSEQHAPSQTAATIQFSPGATTGWIRPEVRSASGALLMLGNPVYVRAKP